MDYKDFAGVFVFGEKRVSADSCLDCGDNLESFVRTYDSGRPVDKPLTPKARGIANICRYCINLLKSNDKVVMVHENMDSGYRFTLMHEVSESEAVFEFNEFGGRYDASLVLKSVNDKFKVDDKTKVPGQAAKVMLYLESPGVYKKRRKTTKMSNRMRARPDSGLYQ